MKLASGFCIPEPLPVHTGIKGRQVHPLIRFLLQSRVDEKCADLHKPFISYLFLVGVTVQSAESLSAAIPRALKEQITDDRVFFKMLFRPCLSGCGRFLSADDGHDRCLQCLGFQHAEDAFVDDSCACCGCMSMTSLRSHLSERIGTLCRHPCSVLWLEQRTTGWRSGSSEGDSKSLSAGHAPTDLLLLTQQTSRPVPG